MAIRREVSEIIGELIPPNGWNTKFKEMQKNGRLDTKMTMELITLILKKLEDMESDKPLQTYPTLNDITRNTQDNQTI